ncbi:MAG: YfcE family phosphodiesterase [Eubacterium sp.]|nr:YfcE family phosphodiesterase [Eubacterium sp.]
MKKALLLSDSHNQNDEMFAVVEYFSDVDAIFHMGDIGNARPLLESRARCLTYVVKGNTDHDFDLPEYVAIDFAGKRVVATHGHRYADYGVTDALRYFGEENHADVLLFGHIHRPVLAEMGNLIICNPGSISRPRQRDRECTFATMSVEGDDIEIQHFSCDVDMHGKLILQEYEVYSIE